METPNPAAAAPLFPLFLVEAIGDSEANDPAWCADVSETSEADYDSDDAESCVCDSSDHRILDPDESKACDGEDVGAPAGTDGDERRKDRSPVCPVGLPEQDQQISPEERKSCVSVDSASPANEFVNEMERSRLFWEACLASS